MNKPTPGPWHEAKSGNHQGLVVDEETGANIAVTYDKAHAQLVAKAPRLRDACRAVVERWEKGDLAEAARMCAAALEGL
jgi:hypothetical protein